MAEWLSGGRWVAAKHHDLLAEKLVDIVAGRIKRLIVEMPPRHGKSELCSVWFPVWYLNLRPEARIILSSYEADFAASWGRRVRNTIQEHAPELRARIADDSSAANRWHTTAGGGMVTAGVGGAITGRGADVLIVDDPIKNAQEANSATVREHIWEWWTSTARTRLQPDGAVILVMTRWHLDDLAGRLKSQEDGEEWEVLTLPAVAEGEDVLGRNPGDPLWPEQYDGESLERTQGAVGPYVWDALYQQRPTAPGGAIMLREWWEHRRYDIADRKTQLGTVGRYISWDTGMKDGDDNAYTVAAVGDLWADYRLGLRDVYRHRLTFPALPQAIESMAHTWNHDGKLRGIIVEDKASGISAIQTLRSSAPKWISDLLIPFQPSGDKEHRAKQAAVWCANGSVWLPKPDDKVPWLFDFERELFEFPRAQFADQVDAFSQLILYVEHLLSAGHHARETVTGEVA